ncbi:hypothetical protein FM114_06190 [Luteococcus japonicus LSP_Lj1]|uniref:Secreted protein n=1 Tax=Luteococcus japonicus LSP_Lj1 TaxID=1255658 RepID=A0A1R4J8W3_9ACTN|nr:hypothetical protein FM114_06190 [Luteococcus japonicus LSP_Lj1]
MLAMLFAVLGLATVVAIPASAEDVPTLSVVLSQVTPVSPSATDTVTLQGSVTNTSSKPVTNVQVHLWRSSDAVTDGEVLTEVLASDPANPVGRRMLQPENIFNITDVGAQPSQAFPSTKASPKKTFAPGESADFTVRAPVQGANGLGFATPGAYLVGIQVRGIPEDGQNQTLGRARSLVVFAPEASRPHSSVATVALLSSRPSRTGDGVFADDHLAGELTGRLRQLVTLARQPGVTALVDPALVDAVTDMADGYRVTGSTSPTTQGQQAAEDFLTQLGPVVSGGAAYRTLQGGIDVQLAVDSGHPELVELAAATPPTGHLLAKLPLAVVPADLKLGDNARNVLDGIKPALVLAENAASGTAVQRWSDDAESALVVPRTSIHDGGPGPDPTRSAPQLAGRLQATQFVQARPMVSLVSTSAQASAELVDAPWRTRTPLPALVAASGTTERFVASPQPAHREDRSWLDEVKSGRADLTAWGELVAKGNDAERLTQQVLPQALSTSWRGDRAAALRWLVASRSQVGSVLTSNKVNLHVVSKFVTSSSNQEVPVTISNGLPDPVHVRIAFDSENPQRINVADTDVLTVGPGDSETVKVRVSTHANGEVGVQARLTTPTGRAIGTPRNLTITATQAGRVGWIIIIASGVVFLAGTAMRIRQVQRERRGSANVAGTTGPMTRPACDGDDG